MMNAIGVIESSSIAKGFEICDAMAKASLVTFLEAAPVCPGKYMIIIGGLVADVAHSVETGVEIAGSLQIDHLVIPNIDPQVFAAINRTGEIGRVDALGILETYSVAAGISVADIAVKAAAVDLIEVRLSRGMGGKAFVLMTGTVADVTAAVDAASETVSTGGLLAAKTVIPSPHPDMIKYLY